MRRQLQSLLGAARILGDDTCPRLWRSPVRKRSGELSRGFNQLALNLEALESDRRLMLVGISHDLSVPLPRLRLAIELAQMKSDVSQLPGMIQDVAEVCQRYVAVGKDVRCNLGMPPAFGFRPLAVRRLDINLVDNAARHADCGIEVNTRYVDGKVTLSVLDRGPGIQSMDPNSLIKPFARENVARYTAGRRTWTIDRGSNRQNPWRQSRALQPRGARARGNGGDTGQALKATQHP